MSKFLQDEKPFQADFKAKASYFSVPARAEGIYKDHPYPFALPRECAHENLAAEIRDPIRAYFKRNEIKWHDGQDGNPSNHMCDSMVCCANFLFPFYDKPKALAGLLRPIFPDLHIMLPIEDGQYVAFEWIGAKNYLGEKISNNGKRTRGANFTSADAAVRFVRNDGKIQIALIEWKYTESYYQTFLKFAASGTDRTKIYEHLYLAGDCPVKLDSRRDYENLFYEPFYQFMRQQFLAHEMEKAHELCADIVSLLHISPAHNEDFKRITSPGLERCGTSATGVWSALQKSPERFLSVFSEDLFGTFPVEQHPEMKDWWQYITQRYRWVLENSA